MAIFCIYIYFTLPVKVYETVLFWGITKKDEKIHFFHKDFPVSKLYYLIRNHTYLSKKFIENKLYFYGNMIVYSISLIRFLFKTSPKNFVYRYALYIKAVRDGLKENLGKKDI